MADRFTDAAYGLAEAPDDWTALPDSVLDVYAADAVPPIRDEARAEWRRRAEAAWAARNRRAEAE
jgi:hypothetical protein